MADEIEINVESTQIQVTVEAAFGVKGEKGDTGEQGPQGPQGNTGPQGIQGPKGDTGDQGPQGIQGIQGAKGDTGNTGPQGAQGIQGVKGDTGDTGPQGVQGIQGTQGPQGDTGPQGPQGNAAVTPKGSATAVFVINETTKTVIVTDTNVLPASLILFTVVPTARDLDEMEYVNFSISYGNIVSGTSFDVTLTDLLEGCEGSYTINYTIIN